MLKKGRPRTSVGDVGSIDVCQAKRDGLNVLQRGEIWSHIGYGCRGIRKEERHGLHIDSHGAKNRRGEPEGSMILGQAAKLGEGPLHELV